MDDSHPPRRSQDVSSELVGLADTPDVSISMVGGKAQTLGRLMRAGFKVPVGWSVPADFDTEEIGSRLETKGPGNFAVRSSGVTEDSAHQSQAGRYQSLLNVGTESIAVAVNEVRQFARQRDGETIPVLIQSMVHPVCAGVAFSADPVTGNRSTTVVTGSGGLADRLVAGEVTGDEWVIDGNRAKPRRRPQGVLDRRLALRVARMAERIADELGEPQDVEWAWDGKELWVVQARPITSLPPDVEWSPPVPGIYHRSLRFGEWIPEPITPLCESWLLTHMEREVHRYLEDLVGQVAEEPHHVVVNGWYYYSLNWLPVPGVAFWRNFVSIVPQLPKKWRNVAGMFPQTIRFASRGFENGWREEILPQYRQTVSLAEEQVDGAAPHELVDLVDRLTDAAGRYFGSIAVVAGSAYKWEAQLAKFWKRHLKDELGVSHMVVLQGFEQAEVTSQTPRMESLDWWRPTSPPTAPPENLENLRKQRHATERRATSVLEGSPRRLATYRELLEETQHLMPVREEQISQLSLAWPIMRRAVRRIGETLVASGAIESVDDVFFLTKSETVGLIDTPDDVRGTVVARRQEWEEANKLTPPLTVGRIPRIVRLLFSLTSKIQGAEPTQSALVHGTPASAGRATGKVRVIRSASQFEDFQQGEILVAPLTAPAWTDLFSRAAAVVTDVGSALAHASIIAREYGIPAVVGCGDATSRLQDGQIVTVDGSSGNVEPAASAEPA